MVEVGKERKFGCNTPLMTKFFHIKIYTFCHESRPAEEGRKFDSRSALCFGRASPFIAMTSATVESI